MEQNLQTVLDLIKADANLSPDEKAVIIARLNAADKKMGVDAFRIERGEHLKKTMSVLLDETIEELEQKRKAVEEKNRDLEIEAALERVRTVAMGMRTADDLLNICKILFQELVALGFGELRNAMINIVNDEKGSFLNYDFNSSDASVTPFQYNSHPVIERQVNITRSAGDAFIEHILTGDDLEDFKAFRVKNGETPDPKLENISALYYYFYSIGIGSVGISTFSSLTEDKLNVLKRFRNVFDLAYRRYADIQLAAAQAREAQIELALERVRARTMAMQHSEELAETAFILFQQFKELGENPDQATIGIINEEEHVVEYWVTMYGSQTNKVFKFSIDEPNVTHKIYKAWKAKKKSLVIDLSGKALLDFTTYRASMGGAGFNPAEKRRVINVAFFSKGIINVQSTEARSEESIRLLERFAGVFDQTYTRFLDLQKAEAQAREAQIELSLERVRASAMAMHQTDQLLDAAELLYRELTSLGVKSMAITYAIMAADEKSAAYYSINPVDGKLNPVPFDLSHTETEVMRFILSGWKKQEAVSKLVLDEEATLKHQTYIAGIVQAHFVENNFDQPFSVEAFLEISPKKAIIYAFHFAQGYIFIIGSEHLTKPQEEMVMRFTKVFEMTYRRFLDLKQAEEQAREAQIQLALERVRARTMAMQKSDELLDAASLLFKQIADLGTESWSSGFMIGEPEDNSISSWMSRPDGSMGAPFNIPLTEDPFFIRIYEARQRGEDFYVLESAGKELEETYKYMFSLPEAGKVMGDIENLGFQIPTYQITHCAFFSHGFLMFITYEPCPEMWDIFKRFGNVFEQTYTRFLDLQRAEEQARESQIQLGLERVRAKAMAMQTSEELNELIGNVFSELTKLDFVLTRCLIMIFDLETKASRWWMANSEAPAEPMNYLVQNHKNPAYDAYLKAWKERNLRWNYALKGKVKRDWDDFLFVDTELAQLPGPVIAGMKAPEQVLLSASFNNFGCLTLVSLEPLSDEHSDIMLRFAKVFDMCYTRFNDLKQAEEQARESQIQLALERVRARTMAMQKSEELHEVIQLVFDQLQQLNFDIDVANFALNYKETDDFELVLAVPHGKYPVEIHVPYFKHPVFDRFNKAKKKEGLLVDRLSKEEKDSFFEHFFKYVPGVPEETKASIFGRPGFVRSSVLMKNTALTIHNYDGISYSEAQNNTLLRFGQVFEQTYTRFLDLQKAEEQAREAQVELSLERIRAKTMAMHTSEHVGETVATMFDELVKLGIEKTVRCGILIIDETKHMEVWTAAYDADGKVDMLIGRIDMMVHPLISNIHEAWKNKEQVRTYELADKDLKAYYKAINDSPEYPVQFDLATLPAKQTNNAFFFPEGAIFAFTLEPLAENEVKLFKRFAGVFGLTYRRYLDLQKAEAQAKESQIQLALERVRARTMAMQKSGELAETSVEVFKQLIGLGIAPNRLFIGIIKDNSGDIEFWATDEDGSKISTKFTGNTFKNRSIKKMYDAWKARKKSLTIDMQGKELTEYFHYMADELKVPFKQGRSQKRRVQSIAYFSQGFIGMASPEEQPQETVDLMERFAGVFNLSYTRFNDLKLAEEQAREAKIEAALEKVRGKALAMYSSADLTSTASMVFTELRKLGINPIRCGVGMFNNGSRKVALYSATSSADGDSLGLLGWVMLQGHPVLGKIYDSLVNNEDYFPVLKGKQLKTYYENLLSGLSLPALPDFHPGEEQYGHFLPFPDGCLYAWAERRYDETEIRILRRFAGVIDLTFRRYNELQKSEASAREAVRAASLDRVRAEIASMRSTEDLDRITPLIWNELTILGIPFIRCGVFIIDHEEQVIHTHLSTADGKALATFNLTFDSQGIGQNVLPAWREKQAATIHWSAEEFAEYTKNLVDQGSVKSRDKYVTEHPDTSLDLHFLPFLQGMLYVGNINPLTVDEMDLVQSLADAFSTAYARYEDFNKLEAAKKQVENTLTDLKAAQTKLIQSEKMASLGELTAGIAHEIQNPLNFVNNFSEVNQEMIDELADELKAGNIEEALAIAADIKDNEQKINHHGKRADGIVKGMLQHSRTGGGEKQPTNINALADEFMRLSYHGLRAKDKVFNAELVTHFDPDLPKASVIGQDIGRVLLNLFNNAFYAVNQKKKALNGEYKPEVTVTTLTENGQVVIKVKDNGVGMPEHIKEKIMQPFFTTKPTGEGTGLGLSLTYDMVVKGHGGSIQVNSTEGEGSEFIIALPIN